MIPRLAAVRDRAGHRLRHRGAALGVAVMLLLGLASSASAASQEYAARRFDVNLEVLPSGDLRVSETIVFVFESGEFRRVWRAIPGTRTDGIEVLAATMDGVPMPVGDGTGTIEVSGGSRKRVEWRFAPVSASTHTFGLTYIAHGVGVRTDDADLVAWQPLPTEHGYDIAESRITVEAASTPTHAEIVEPHGIERSSVTFKAETIEAKASGIRRNGRLTLALRFPRGTIVNAQPEWSRHNEYVASLAPRWLLAAGSIFVLILLAVFAVRRQEEAPDLIATESTVVSPPEPLAPALATALVANGHPSAASAAATLLDLADRGVLTIRELPRRFGARSYEIAQVPGAHPLLPHEESAITIAFAGGGDDVTLSKAQGRLARGARRFSAALEADMNAEGIVDAPRYAVARRLKTIGITLLLVGAAAVVPAATLINTFGGWPLMIPLAVVLGGLAGIIAGGTMTVLSNTGAFRAARWRGFKQHLKRLADDKESPDGTAVPSRFVVYGVALGLARQWARYLKRHPGSVPPWFVAGAQDSADAGAAFAALVSTSSHGGGAGGGTAGAAAGGGGSGAG